MFFHGEGLYYDFYNNNIYEKMNTSPTRGRRLRRTPVRFNICHRLLSQIMRYDTQSKSLLFLEESFRHRTCYCSIRNFDRFYMFFFDNRLSEHIYLNTTTITTQRIPSTSIKCYALGINTIKRFSSIFRK